jgi:excisionase family DNA binding protein
MEPGEVAVDVRELARLLGVSADTIRLRARRSEIPAFRIGRRYRFFPSEVREHYRRQQEQVDDWAMSSQSRHARRLP